MTSFSYEVVITPFGAPEGSRSVDENFERLRKVGEGTFGEVWMARDRADGSRVALKRIRMDNEREGFPITALREIKLLSRLRHPNVVHLKEIVTSEAHRANDNKGSIYMVFEYLDNDLAGLASLPGFAFTLPQAKCVLRQVLLGLAYCHAMHVVHRDMKGSNILVNSRGELKLADFGLAREAAHAGDRMTGGVVTLWYRAPELLLGMPDYGRAVDVWSVGCIFWELLAGKALLPGKDEAEQVKRIQDLCGTPTEINWPGCSRLRWYSRLVVGPEQPCQLRQRLQARLAGRAVPESALDLAERMLCLDPARRISARDALLHPFFAEAPRPCAPAELPRHEAAHEYAGKRRAQEEREEAKRQRQRQFP